MRRFKTLLLLVVLLGATPCAFAQFSISKVTPEQVEIKVIEDSSKKKIVNLDNNFYSRARYKAERRAIRQERNTLQINASAMFNQTGFTNWYAGGDNVFSTSLAFYFSHKYVKNKFNLQTTFDARYGINRINKENFKNEDAFVFNLSSSWGINKNWSYAATFQYRSQFSKGYKSRTDNTLVSNFMAPGTIAPAIGFIYRNKKVPLTINIMPVSGSVTFVLDTVLSNQGAYGVNPGEKSTGAIGAALQVDFEKSFCKDKISYRTYFYAFSNYNTNRNAYINWKNTLSFKIYKFLTAEAFCSAVYDEAARTPEQRQWLQLNYKLGIGLAYTFKNK